MRALSHALRPTAHDTALWLTASDTAFTIKNAEATFAVSGIRVRIVAAVLTLTRVLTRPPRSDQYGVAHRVLLYCLRAVGASYVCSTRS